MMVQVPWLAVEQGLQQHCMQEQQALQNPLLWACINPSHRQINLDFLMYDLDIIFYTGKDMKKSTEQPHIR